MTTQPPATSNLPVPTDASDFYRWMWLCYAAGRTDERGERPLEMEGSDAAIVNLIRSDYALRMERFIQVEPRPEWLETYIEHQEAENEVA